MPAPRPRVWVDAGVLFAGAAAPSQHGASLVILRVRDRLARLDLGQGA